MVPLVTTTTTALLILTFCLSFIETKDFKVFWNIPTFMCTQYGMDFSDIGDTFNINQNFNDSFRGEKISILYDPGKFPALLEDRARTLFRRNGGVPQEGNLQEHLEIFSTHMDELIPDKQFSGIAVIDFESWRPIYRQNFGSLQPYKDLSVKIEKEKHPLFPPRRLEADATKRFEAAGKEFMDETLNLAKVLRPNAQWGYYAFPYCFNMNGASNQREDCALNVQQENNKIMWLFSGSDIIYPSVYLREKLSSNDRLKLVRGRVREAVRIANKSKVTKKPKILTYMRYVYTDTLKYLTETDWINALTAMRNLGSDGVILWGSSFDLNSKNKCKEFKSYLDNTLGPVIQSLFQPRYIVEDIFTE